MGMVLTAQHIQHSTAQHSTAQHSTAQHSTAQHSTGVETTFCHHVNSTLMFVMLHTANDLELQLLMACCASQACSRDSTS